MQSVEKDKREKCGRHMTPDHIKNSRVETAQEPEMASLFDNGGWSTAIVETMRPIAVFANERAAPKRQEMMAQSWPRSVADHETLGTFVWLGLRVRVRAIGTSATLRLTHAIR